MKTRSGFVSNSSSSSFIVAVKKQEPCPHCKRTDVNFLDIIDTIGKGQSDSYEATQLHARGAMEVYTQITTMLDSWTDAKEKKEWASRLGKWIDAEEKGYEIGYFEMSYHDDSTSTLLDSLKWSGTVKVLWGEHCSEESEL